MAPRPKCQLLLVVETSRLAWRPHEQALVRARAWQGLRAQKSKDVKYSALRAGRHEPERRGASRWLWVRGLSSEWATPRPPMSRDAQRTRSAHGVLEQLERDGISDVEI